MARYFFNVDDGASAEDGDGCELADLADVRAAAASLAGGLLRDGAATFGQGRPWSVSVLDEAGSTVYVIRLTASTSPEA